MPLACLLEVHAHPAGDATPPAGHARAFVNVFLRDFEDPPADLLERMTAACLDMGYELHEIVEVNRVRIASLPEDLRPAYDRTGVGFGAFHAWPDGDPRRGRVAPARDLTPVRPMPYS